MQNVVPVADVRQSDLSQIPKFLLQREIVRQRLAGMFDFAESIDYRNARKLRHSFDRLVGKRAQHNRTHPSLEIVSNIAQRLTRVQPLMPLIDKRYRSPQTANSRLKCDPRAQRWLFEKHRNVLARERRPEILWARLHRSREFKQRLDFNRRQIAD